MIETVEEKIKGNFVKSLEDENTFIKELINLVPASYYFDQDVKDQLLQIKHDATDLKLATGFRKGKEIKPDIKNRFSKLDPEQFKTVTDVISTLNGPSKKDPNQRKIINPLKPEINSMESLQQRFQEKMEEVQRKKMNGAPDSELSETQLNRRTKRKINRQRAKEKKKVAAQQSKLKMKNLRNHVKKEPKSFNNQLDNNSSSTKPIFNKKGDVVFSKFDFADERKKQNKTSNKDYKGLLQKVDKVQKKMQNLADKDEEKAKSFENNLAWKSALQKSEGIKVKDDPELLKKAMKKQEQKKRKSQKEWTKREEHVKKLKSDKQTKRKENIQKRISDKKSKKMKKAVKKGRIIPGFS